MANDSKIYCPECGAYIHKGFMTCTNCKMKVRLSKQSEKKKAQEEKPKQK